MKSARRGNRRGKSQFLSPLAIANNLTFIPPGRETTTRASSGALFATDNGCCREKSIMSDEIPFHIQEEIMKRLPVKSLIQFRSVSKAWKALIESSDFIAAHCVHSHTQPQHLLVSHRNLYKVDSTLFCDSYIDDDTFPKQRSYLTVPPLSAQRIVYPSVVGSSHGLVCLHGRHSGFKTDMTFLWNPSIRKYIVIAAPVIANALGFGVCPVTGDPKIVIVTYVSRDVPETSYQCEIMVYTLSSGKWRSLSTNFPTERIQVFWSVVAIDRFIYWHAGFSTHTVILSFDVTNDASI